MQNISISLVMTSSKTEVPSVKTTKANDNTFENFMMNHGAKVKQNAQSEDVLPTKKNDMEVTSYDSNDNKDVVKSDKSDLRPDDKFDSTKDTLQVNDETTKELTPEQMEEVLEQVVVTLQQIFQIPEELVQDVLNQMNIGLEDLVMMVSGPDAEQMLGEFAKEFVMELHGIADQATFLTNDTLATEMNQIIDEIKKVDVQEVELRNVLVEGEPEAKIEVETDLNTKEIAGEEVLTDNNGTASTENQTDSETPDDQGDSRDMISVTSFEQTDGTKETVFHDNMQTFTENLNKAFEVARDVSAETHTVTPQQIVEQIVEQVKVRVMPETTNLEMQLHPESLGRVNVQVSAAAQGTTTAVITVETQFAKEALESQLLTLKQNFQEQGLKVDSVEVTVSDFDLGHEERDANNQRQKDRKGPRRFRPDAGPEEEEDIGLETDSSRRSVDSTVDYTA